MGRSRRLAEVQIQWHSNRGTAANFLIALATSQPKPALQLAHPYTAAKQHQHFMLLPAWAWQQLTASCCLAANWPSHTHSRRPPPAQAVQ